MGGKMQKEMEDIRNQLNLFVETDLKIFQKPEQFISQAEKLIGWKFYTCINMYERLWQFYKERQREILTSQESIDMVLAMSLQNNEAFKREMNSLDNGVKNTARDSISMKTDLGKIFLDAVLKRSRIQWYKSISLSGANFLYVAENYEELYRLILKCTPKNEIIARDKDYNEIVSKVAEKLPERFHKIYDIILLFETRKYVKENEEAIKSILEKYSTETHKRVIEMYLGVGCEPMSYEEIGKILGISEERVQKQFVDGMKKLNFWLRKEFLCS